MRQKEDKGNVTVHSISAGLMGFPGSSGSKESACDAGDLGLIPRSGRSSGEGNGNPLQYSCLKNSMNGGAWQLQSTGCKESDIIERLTLQYTTHSRILAWRIPWTEEPGGLQSMGSQRVRHD